jgi:hypothetical protein
VINEIDDDEHLAVLHFHTVLYIIFCLWYLKAPGGFFTPEFSEDGISKSHLSGIFSGNS